MARLFITPREVDYISDLTKEIVKDVIGQKVYYYSISMTKTAVHEVYDEAPDKIFENPIEIDALVTWAPEEVRTNKFGSEEYYGIEVFLHNRDMLDKGIEVSEGDFFSYGAIFFEITSAIWDKQIYGQVEYKTGVKLTGRQARKSLFTAKVLGPTYEGDAEPGAVQDTFVQQRGFDRNSLGETGDKRALKDKGVLEAPITEPKEVSSRGDSTGSGSSFYDE
jgi:hypothetical protein